MKTYIAIAIAAALMFGLGMTSAYALNDVGTELYLSEFETHGTPMVAVTKVERFALPDDDAIPALSSQNDIGSRIYASAFESRDVAMADFGVKGSAAGGMAKEDEITKIWDNLLGKPGGSDLP